MAFIDSLSSFLYYPLLIIVLIAAGLYFSARTGFVQFRLFGEAIRVISEKPSTEGGTSSFKALMVSTASRVGTGNIVGVSTAVCLGGFGAAFWMWLIALIGMATAFVESTLAQIYKRRDTDGSSYGGPAYYIQDALHSRSLGIVFSIFLILTYAFGFNMLASYNMQDSFKAYSFYNPSVTPWIIGGIMALLVFWCLLGGGKRIANVASALVPVMGVIYVIVALVVIVANIGLLPAVIKEIFADAFNFKAIFGGIAGSCMMYGTKRGLYSNEAGVGSAPNAAAAADVSHPVKQGLVQMFSVFLDTIIICTATAMMCMCSGVEPSEEIAGAMYVQLSVASVLGNGFGPWFVTVSLMLFGFTTLIGNLYYCNNALAFINNNKMPGKSFMMGFYIVCALLIFVGAGLSMGLAWSIADILQAFMCLINIPTCIILGKVSYAACKDYIQQRELGRAPVFHAKDIGMDASKLDYWQ